MYYNTQTQTFGRTHAEVAKITNSSFAVGTLEVGPYRLYEQAPEPEYDAATHRVEPSNTITERTGAPWLRGWDVIALTPAEIEAAQKARVPNSVPNSVLRQALIDNDLLGVAATALDALPANERERLLVDWEYATHFFRDGRVVTFLKGAFGMTDAAVDDFFIAVGAEPAPGDRP